MYKKTTTILLLVFTFIFILSSNFSSAASCSGGIIELDCEPIDCSQFRGNFGECLNEPTSYCVDFQDEFGTDSCVNKDYSCTPNNYQCPNGCDVVTSVDCSNLVGTSCSNQEGCTWNPDTAPTITYTCTESAGSVVIKKITNGVSAPYSSDSKYCSESKAYTYSCASGTSQYATQNYVSCDFGCNGAVCANAPEPFCGDGEITGNEECDDENYNKDSCAVSWAQSRPQCDYCSNSCTEETDYGPYCGDGEWQSSKEECDYGDPAQNTFNDCRSVDYGETCTYCSSSCDVETNKGAKCGDGTCNIGDETKTSCVEDCAGVTNKICSTSGLTSTLKEQYEDNSKLTVETKTTSCVGNDFTKYRCSADLGVSTSIIESEITCQYGCTTSGCLDDTSKPRVSIISPEGNTDYNDQISKLKFTASDNDLSLCKYSITGSPWSTVAVVDGKGEVDLGSSVGINEWNVRCWDTSGNFNTSIVSFNILPQVTIENEVEIITCVDSAPVTTLQSSIYGVTDTVRDICLEDNLVENYCEGDSIGQMSPRLCEYGCQDGTCKPKPEEVEKTEVGKSCSVVDSIRTTKLITYSDGSTLPESKDNYCLDKTTLIKYSCVNNGIVQESIDCESGCESSVCQSSTSYWANINTETQLTATPAVTTSSPQEVKLIIENAPNKEISSFEIFEKTTEEKIGEATPELIENNLVASYTFTSDILDKAKLESGELSFYFKSILGQSPDIKLLIQKEELMCPTENTENYNNNICDDGETGLLCPLDCFIVGDGICNEKLDENIFISFYDCGATINKKIIWADKKDLTTEVVDTIKLDTDKIHEESFFMIFENSEKESELDFELIGIKNLAEVSLGVFTGIANDGTVSYEWTPEYSNFENIREITDQTEFRFFFKINNLRSSALKIELTNYTLPTCFDGTKNGNEEKTDCGGSCSLSCDEVDFCRENQIVSCSAYTAIDSAEDYCNENPCNLYSDSSSTCYWDAGYCERKKVLGSGVCYYKEELENEDTCDDGYLIYSYDSSFEWGAEQIESRKDSSEDGYVDGGDGYYYEDLGNDFSSCEPISEAVYCKASENTVEKLGGAVVDAIVGESEGAEKLLKIIFLVSLAVLIMYFSFKVLKTEQKTSPQERIKNSFKKSQKEKSGKEKEIKGEVVIKTKKEREIEELMKDFEMDI